MVALPGAYGCGGRSDAAAAQLLPSTRAAAAGVRCGQQCAGDAVPAAPTPEANVCYTAGPGASMLRVKALRQSSRICLQSLCMLVLLPRPYASSCCTPCGRAKQVGSHDIKPQCFSRCSMKSRCSWPPRLRDTLCGAPSSVAASQVECDASNTSHVCSGVMAVEAQADKHTERTTHNCCCCTPTCCCCCCTSTCCCCCCC
jgi:hypothetical protein